MLAPRSHASARNQDRPVGELAIEVCYGNPHSDTRSRSHGCGAICRPQPAVNPDLDSSASFTGVAGAKYLDLALQSCARVFCVLCANGTLSDPKFAHFGSVVSLYAMDPLLHDLRLAAVAFALQTSNWWLLSVSAPAFPPKLFANPQTRMHIKS